MMWDPGVRYGVEEVRGICDQDTWYTCMKFSRNKSYFSSTLSSKVCFLEDSESDRMEMSL